jgi:predicted acyltransferase
MNTFIKNLNYFNINDNNAVSEERVLSVDALRGFDMFWIIGGREIFRGLDKIFNNSITGFIKGQLKHADWLGFNFYDIIMPLFLFLVGISMVYSFRKRLKKDSSKVNLWKHILIRFLWLWVLGMVVQGKLLTYDINEIKLYSNTLQAIAAGYIIAAALILYANVFYQVVLTSGLMLLYWLLIQFVPVPGFGAGNYTPEGNFAIYIDRVILGKFQDGSTYSWILSSLNFGATTMLGVFTGYLLQSQKKPVSKFFNMIIAGLLISAVGLIWNFWHPSIKHIWTGSFTLISGGLCLLLLAVFYCLIDILSYRKGSKIFIIVGSNAIAAYVSAHIFDFRLVAEVFLKGFEKYIGTWYPFVLASGGFLVLYLILRFMHKNKIFIKV